MNGIKCDGELDGQLLTLCKLLQQSVEDMDDKLDELQLQTWIVAGVCGGVALILIFIVIALFSQVYRLKQSSAGRDKLKPTPERTTKSVHNGNTSTDNAYPRHPPPPHSYAQSPKNLNLTSEEELAQMGFSAYTGQARGMATSPSINGSTGGVRVLPRNPPTGFRNNGAYNDGFM